MTNTLTVYTDGGCTGNPGPGGWAAIIGETGNMALGNEPLEISGGDRATTNNRMELTAVIHALEFVMRKYGCESKIEIHTDSKYVQYGITQWMPSWIDKGWKTAAGKPVKNKDLWLHLRELNEKLEISWLWVKGHSGNSMNERCNQLVAFQRKLFS